MKFLCSIDYQTRDDGALANYQERIEIEGPICKPIEEIHIRALDIARKNLCAWAFNVLGVSEPIIWDARILGWED